MQAAEIGKRASMNDTAFSGTEQFFKNANGIRAGDGVHGIKAHGETVGKKLFDGRKIKNFLHHIHIVKDGVDNFNFHTADILSSEP